MKKEHKKPKFPRAFFHVPMGTKVIPPKKGKGSPDLSPYSRKAKHRKTTANDKFDAVVFYLYLSKFYNYKYIF